MMVHLYESINLSHKDEVMFLVRNLNLVKRKEHILSENNKKIEAEMKQVLGFRR